MASRNYIQVASNKYKEEIGGKVIKLSGRSPKKEFCKPRVLTEFNNGPIPSPLKYIHTTMTSKISLRLLENLRVLLVQP